MLQISFRPRTQWPKWPILFPLLATLIAFLGIQHVQGQGTFDSHSTGADGPLTLPNSSTPVTVVFDPASIPNHPAGSTIFNFTTITIGSNVTLKLTSQKLSGPVIFLAQGDVVINGIIDLAGEDGAVYTNQTSARIPAAGGPGGYSGGVGGSIVAGQPTALPGNGAGGGAVSPTPETTTGQGGTFTGNQFLTPLVGGSGGGGANRNAGAGNFGGGGGGGGGGIWIASSMQISMSGYINAEGGVGGGNCTTYCGGNGSGGAVRLIANTISGGGAVYARPGRGTNPGAGGIGTAGIVRCESNNGGCFGPMNFFKGTPVALILPTTTPPVLIVTSIDGMPLNSTGFNVNINTTSPVTVSVQGQYVPIGTVPKIYVFSEAGPDQVISATALQGTFASSTATAQVTFPSGGSRGYVKATW